MSTAPRASESVASMGPPAIPPAPSEADRVDTAFPNDDQPELVTARHLFPTAFGFTDGSSQEKSSLPHFSYLFDHLTPPPAHCLNSVAQPSIADLQLGSLAKTSTDEDHRSFTVEEAIVLKDWARHYVLAVPKGATGGLELPTAPTFGVHDEPVGDERFLIVLSDVTIIDPKGTALRLGPQTENSRAGGAILGVTFQGRIRLCADDLRYRAAGCPGSDARVRVADAPPRDFDVRRCEPGCSLACAAKEIRPRVCPTPPAPRCVGAKQRIFLSARDVGGYCVHGEWDVQCESGCQEAGCSGAPVFAWSRTIGAGQRAIALDAQSLATIADGELVTMSTDGDTLRREKLPNGDLFRPVSDEHGHLFTLDTKNVLREKGGISWSRQLEGATPAYSTGVQYRAGRLYVTRATGLTCLDAADGHMLWHADLGATLRPYVVFSETSLAVQTHTAELVVLDFSGAERGRAKLSSEVLGQVALFDQTVTVYVKTGEVLSGRIDNLRPITVIPQAESLLIGTAQLSEKIVLLNRGTDDQRRTTVHALEVPTGRELWSFSAAGVFQWPPPIDRSGNILFVGKALTSVTASGVQRFQIDFRSGIASEAIATLGLDGTSLYIRDPRALTKFTGL